MSEMQHTDGPWEWEGDSLYGKDFGYTVPIIDGADFPDENECYKGNRALIAAAPDLLEALMAIEMARHTDAKEDWIKATALTDAAIVKATVCK